MNDHEIISHLSTPSRAMMTFADDLAQGSKWPVLDAGCGFGRNGVALALRGVSVVCVDHDLNRLRQLARFAPDCIDGLKRPGTQVGQLHPLCAELDHSRWPFPQNCFSAIICVHFVRIELFDLFGTSLVEGGHLFVETFGGHGQNYLDLPKAGELRDLLLDQFHLLFYQERAVGPPSHGAVSAKLLARKRNAIDGG